MHQGTTMASPDLVWRSELIPAHDDFVARRVEVNERRDYPKFMVQTVNVGEPRRYATNWLSDRVKAIELAQRRYSELSGDYHARRLAAIARESGPYPSLPR